MGISGISNAATTTYSGTVAYLRVHDLAAEGVNSTWVTISGFTSFGTCGVQGEGVILKIKDDDNGKRQFAMLTAAHIAGKKVLVGVDDARKIGPYCILWYVGYAP